MSNLQLAIACSVANCTNPVIGQCTGYKRDCRRYYCHEHSLGTLCFDCKNLKLIDEEAERIYKEYLEIANSLEKEPFKPSEIFVFRQGNIGKYWKNSSIIGAIILIESTIMWGLFSIFRIEIALWDILKNLFNAGILIGLMVIGWPIAIIPIMYIFQWLSWNSIEHQKFEKIKNQKIEEINHSKPGFSNFFKEWKKKIEEENAQKRKEALMGVLAVVGVIAAIALASAASESEDSRTKRAVDDELKKRGL